MKWKEMLAGAETLLVVAGETEVTGLQYDSRKVQRGDAFIAMKGGATDGNKYINAALAQGAVAVGSDSAEQKPRHGIAWAQIAPGNGRRVLGCAAANLYGHPAEKLKLTGVTGTNGKTTTTYLLESMFAAVGRKSALIGTIEYRIAGTVVPSPHTTPESLDLNIFLSEALRRGASEGVMEVSSHALEQGRVYCVPFDVAIFTNLTRDHLDYHGTMEKYFDAKQILFSGSGAGAPRVAVINIDDPYGKKLADVAKQQGTQVFTYGLKAGDFHVKNEPKLAVTGTSFVVAGPAGEIAIDTQLVGTVNIYNILAAAGAAQARGVDKERISAGVRALSHVPGRFQRIDAGQPFTVVVDYAHTDDALRNLTAVARDLAAKSGKKSRVITLFGCGGDRDRAKRPMMGEAAAKGSDFVVLTSDNPRSEDPLRIIHDALAGLRNAQSGAEFTIEPDRKRAIKLACQLAQPGDIVLIAGKGHEKVQITLHGSQPFDDVEIARAALLSVSSAGAGRAANRSGNAGA
jgi:UDP-N-acetylmuramoyl-L-alanyl-D-glutamate--2,6-diaminopimelate ligase